MTSFSSPAFYFQPTLDVKKQLGSAIARYNLFSFLDSNYATSDLMPYVQSSLPASLGSSVNQAKRKLAKKVRRKWIKRLLPLFSGLFPTLPPLLDVVEQPISFLGGTLLQGLNQGIFQGRDKILQDSNWGSTTVRTDSFKGDLAWSTIIEFGAAHQPLRINIDSGSSDLVLFNSSCVRCSLTNHSSYNYNWSGSFQALPDTFSSAYSDGSVIGGYLARDDVFLGGALQVKQQLMGLANNATSDWALLESDGLMGIGPDSLSNFKVKENQGVFSQMVSQKVLRNQLIGIALVKQKARNSQGEFSFGNINKRWIRNGEKEGLSWRPVTSKNFWGLDLNGIYIDGASVMSPKDPKRAIVDTGTSLTLVSRSTAANIHNKIPGSQMDSSNGIWLVPCSIPNQPKDATVPGLKPNSSFNVFFEFGEGKQKFGISAADLAYQVASGGRENSHLKDMCYSGIQAGSESFVVLGDTFIKNVYIVLKYEADGGKHIAIGNRTDIETLY